MSYWLTKDMKNRSGFQPDKKVFSREKLVNPVNPV